MSHRHAARVVAEPPGVYSSGHENPPPPGTDDPDPVPAGHAGAGVGVRGAWLPACGRPYGEHSGSLPLTPRQRCEGDAWAPCGPTRLSKVRLALCHWHACPSCVRAAVARHGRSPGVCRRVGGPLLPLHAKLPLPASDLPSPLSDATGLVPDQGVCVGPIVTLGVGRKRQRRRGPPEDDEHVPFPFR
jgi:hypothetical protein